MIAGLIRLITLLVVLGLGWLVYKRLRASWPPNLRTEPDKPRVERQVQMLRCAHCGLHVPEAEAIRDGEQAYCCQAHRDLAH